MNSLFIIFIILLFSLILSSFLGNIATESFVVATDSSGNTTNYFTNSKIGASTFSSTTDPTTGTTTYDNYNHYDKTSDVNTDLISGTIFYGQNGGEAIVVTGADGQKVIKIVLPNEYTPYVYTYVSVNTWQGNNGTATLVQASNGNTALKISLNNGDTYIYTSTQSSYTQQSSYYPPPPPPQSSSSQTDTTQTTNDSVSSSNSSYQMYDPTTTGIPKSMIPTGQEDLYVLKSTIIPPVCPACPSPIISSDSKKDCPPCPACARCPEPSFECKKVPNYNAVNNSFLPQPVLTDYSQYGM